MNFVAIDFETANPKRDSACQLGLVVVEGGKIIERRNWLIRPPNMYFHPFNIRIHGITPDHVKDEPRFDALFKQLKPYLEGNIIVCHNASFDISVLRHSMDKYKIPYPSFEYACTKIIAEKTWPFLNSYRLNNIAEYLGVKFTHHDALEDAYACAEIAIQACEEAEVDCVIKLSDKLKFTKGELFNGGYIPARARK